MCGSGLWGKRGGGGSRQVTAVAIIAPFPGSTFVIVAFVFKCCLSCPLLQPTGLPEPKVCKDDDDDDDMKRCMLCSPRGCLHERTTRDCQTVALLVHRCMCAVDDDLQAQHA